jgi:hypothetical protein
VEAFRGLFVYSTGFIVFHAGLAQTSFSPLTGMDFTLVSFSALDISSEQ